MSEAPLRGALESADDRIIAGRAADGDRAAFAVLVRRYTPMMRAYARRLLPCTAEVDDVVQETFMTAWERLPDLTDLSTVKSWLMRSTGRKAIDRIRASREHADIDEVPVDPPAHLTPPGEHQAKSLVEELGAALTELPDAQRETWVLRELGNYSYDEIAAELETSVSTVRGLLARARKFLIVRMEQWR